MAGAPLVREAGRRTPVGRAVQWEGPAEVLAVEAEAGQHVAVVEARAPGRRPEYC